MNGRQPYQFEQEPFQDEDGSDCFEKSGIIEENARRTVNNG